MWCITVYSQWSVDPSGQCWISTRATGRTARWLLEIQARYQTIATPFRWTFIRQDSHQLLARLAATADAVRPAA